MNIVRIILTVLIALAFLFFGNMKVTGMPKEMFREAKENHFDNYGIGRGGIRLIGLGEWLGAILIIVGLISSGYLQFSLAGHAVLMVITAGAMYFHNRYDSVTKDGLPAIIQFALNTAMLVWTFTLMG